MSQTIGWLSDENLLYTSTGTRIKSPNPISHEFDTKAEQVQGVVVGDLAATLEGIAETINFRPKGEISLCVFSISPGILGGVGEEDHLDIFAMYDDFGFVHEIEVARPIVRNSTDMLAIIGRLLAMNQVRLLEFEYVEASDFLRLKFSARHDWHVSKSISLGTSIRYALAASSLDPRLPVGVRLLALSGLPESLVGQPESVWLEAKQKGYGVRDEGQRHEMALDFAALANSQTGGIIIVGLRTVRDLSGQDVISEVVGCPLGSISPDVYFAVARDRIVPRIEGFDVHLVPWQDRCLLVVEVPSQPDYIKPFIVKGGIIKTGKVSGASFTIPNRVGSNRWSTSAEAVHSLLVAARLALKGAQSAVPEDE